jgi:succinate dehydrogenase hydrophobic anchor subunit
MRARYAPKRGINLDYLMWLFTRVSGISIVILSLIGLGLAMYMGARLQMDLPTVLRWTFFPIPNHVINSNVPDVTLGWASIFWEIMQFLIIIFAFTHAANGLRMIIEDYLTNVRWQNVVRVVLAIIWIVMVYGAFQVVIAAAY